MERLDVEEDMAGGHGRVRFNALEKVIVSSIDTMLSVFGLRPRNDLYCVGWGVKLYSLTHSLTHSLSVLTNR